MAQTGMVGFNLVGKRSQHFFASLAALKQEIIKIPRFTGRKTQIFRCRSRREAAKLEEADAADDRLRDVRAKQRRGFAPLPRVIIPYTVRRSSGSGIR